MASRLDQALDEVIKDRRSNNNNNNNNNNGSGRRRNNNNNNNNNRDRNDIPRRRQMDNDGYIRKRLGPSDTIKSFVRTVNVQKNDTRGSRNVNSAWAHDMFDDESSAGSSILSRLGGRGTNEPARNKGSYISVENLHYDVTEKDLSELFSTVADVLQAKLVFDISGRSTGVATIKYASLEDAEKAIKKYNNVELDGQSMRIELKEYTPRAPRSTGGGRFNNNRLDSRRNDNRGGDRRGDRRGGDRRGGRDRGNRDDNRNGGGNSRDNKKNDRSKQNMTAEDLDKEMDNYMNSTNNEDTDMMLD